MSNRRTPNTSRLAHESIKPAKQAIYEKIIKGMEILQVGGTFEEIAKASNLEPAQAWKRISEMVDAGTLFNVGITRPTSSGRQAMVRQLTNLRSKPVIIFEKTTPISYFGKAVQTTLFSEIPTHTPEEINSWDIAMDN